MLSPSEKLIEFNREVTCFCGRSVVVSRRPAVFDRFVVCSKDCFRRMVSDQPEYFEFIYGKGNTYGRQATAEA